MRLIFIVSAALFAAACAHGEAPMSAGPPDFARIETTPAPNAAYYADCIGQAAAQGAYGRAADADTDMVLFTCTGTPARLFYDALGPRSAAVGSEVVVGARTYRSTNPVQANLFGVDYCWVDGGTYECTISLNAGTFLRP
ncbi:MAG: hypothetical protein EON90_06435 [Brevundimonas sp.]|nr:MAG: hypothetical protein EON90_06435 [Brevundimonas sp.]